MEAEVEFFSFLESRAFLQIFESSFLDISPFLQIGEISRAVRVVRILILPNKEECARGMERWSKYAAVRVVRIKFNKEECA